MRKKVINLAVLVIGIGLIISLSRDIWRLLKAGDRLKQAQLKVQNLEEESVKLQEQKDYYQSEEFVEEQARNKLNLSKEGETVVVLPANVRELVGRQKSKEPEKIPNWKKWQRLFF